jgi:hypothetical protein
MDPWAAASLSFAERAAQTIQAPKPLPPSALPPLSLHVPGVTHVVASDGSLQPTIFAMVASFRDYMCPDTLEDALLRATYPERIRFAVVQQNGEGDVPCDRPRTVPCETDPAQMLCVHAGRVDVFSLDAGLATGPVPARAIGAGMYAGEFYAMQIDAHLGFVEGWDVQVIEQHGATGNARAVLTT